MPVFVMVGYSQITPIKGWTTDCFRLNDKVILVSGLNHSPTSSGLSLAIHSQR